MACSMATQKGGGDGVGFMKSINHRDSRGSLSLSHSPSSLSLPLASLSQEILSVKSSLDFGAKRFR